MADSRMVGHAQRRRMGAPANMYDDALDPVAEAAEELGVLPDELLGTFDPATQQAIRYAGKRDNLRRMGGQ